MNLPSGQFFGAPLRSVEVNGLRLTLSRYRAGQSQPWHTHEFPTLFFPLQSRLRDRRRQEDCVLEPMTLVYHPTEEIHRSECGTDGTTGLNIEPSAQWLSRYALTPEDLGAYRVLPSPAVRLRALRLLTAAFFQPETETSLLEADALEILSALTPQRFGTSERSCPDWLRRVEAFLRDSEAERVSLREAARETDIHPVYLARVFRAHYGCSVGDYLRRLRLLRASVHALQPDGSLGEAAHEANFADQSHFTREFVRETGLRPSLLLKIRALQ
jgi:AraC-like DNA-binding protein